ncbi:class IV adenylate cyclase [Planctomycetota bacterium]
MATEIEAKLKVDALEPIAEKLLALGATFIEQQAHIDTFYDNSHSSLTKGGRGLRLRICTTKAQQTYILTYKGKRQDSPFKKREELEIQILDPETTENLLLAIGYAKILTIEKTRKLYKFDNCEIALDYLEQLGNFIEIEGPDEKIITEIQKKLNLENIPHIKQGYAKLIKNRNNP